MKNASQGIGAAFDSFGCAVGLSNAVKMLMPWTTSRRAKQGKRKDSIRVAMQWKRYGRFRELSWRLTLRKSNNMTSQMQAGEDNVLVKLIIATQLGVAVCGV